MENWFWSGQDLGYLGATFNKDAQAIFLGVKMRVSKDFGGSFNVLLNFRVVRGMRGFKV